MKNSTNIEEVDKNSQVIKDAIIQLIDIDKVYPNGAQAVFGASLEVFKNEFVVLVGPSGCGKSTTLRMIAGLEEITYGELYIKGKLSNYVESKDRNIAMVFQNYALYPNMTVFENMAFGLKIRKTPKEEIEKRVYKAAKILDLGRYLDRKPKELSGGQMQRVALGRAIVRHVPIFLMDEPLSNLDAKLRVSMRSEIVRIHNEVGATTLYVTHDQIEAMTMASKIVVMNKGFIQQIGAPNDIYNEPCNSFVATFIGTPSMNTFVVEYDEGKICIEGNPIIDSVKLKNAHDKFMNEKIAEIEPLLVDFGYEGASYLRKMKSNRITNNVEETKDVAVKKDGVIKKVTNLFKSLRKDEQEVGPNPLEEELNANLLDLKSQLKKKHDILFGVRPEKIQLRKLKENEKGKIVVQAQIVELLGADYNIFFKLENVNVVAKFTSHEPVKVGDRFELSINKDDVYLFDVVTGSRILF